MVNGSVRSAPDWRLLQPAEEDSPALIPSKGWAQLLRLFGRMSEKQVGRILVQRAKAVYLPTPIFPANKQIGGLAWGGNKDPLASIFSPYCYLFETELPGLLPSILSEECRFPAPQASIVGLSLR